MPGPFARRQPCLCTQHSRSLKCSQYLVQAVVQQLMQQYAMTGTAFLNLGKLKRVPDSLRNPGPNPSLAGDLQIVEDTSAQGRAQIYFTLKPGRIQQLVQFNAASGQYQMLLQPW